jgi:hypothetical protein
MQNRQWNAGDKQHYELKQSVYCFTISKKEPYFLFILVTDLFSLE